MTFGRGSRCALDQASRAHVEASQRGHLGVIERRQQKLIALIIAQDLLRLFLFALTAVYGRERKLSGAISGKKV